MMDAALYASTPSASVAELRVLLAEIKSHQIFLHWNGVKTPIPLGKGILQGGTHSSQTFAAVLEQLFRTLHGKWASEFPDLIDAWIYIDDCLFRFKSWQVLRIALPWILQQFRLYGFRWNLSKTTLASTPQRLREGELLCCPGELVTQLTWTASFKYLGCRLRHPALYADDGATLTEDLLPQCMEKVRNGLCMMQSILKHCHWSRVHTALALLDTYISSKWLWMCPLLEPLRKHLDYVQQLHHTVLCSTLRLFIPSDVKAPVAHALNRIRRRALRELLRTHPRHKAWAETWVVRRWSYFGHVLRREDNHLARRELLTSIVQHRDGRASLPQRWLLGCLRQAKQWPVLTSAHLANLYVTRDEWSDCLPSVLRQHGLSTAADAPALARDTWESWRHAVQVCVSWLWPVWVWQEAGRLHFKWLDREHGWCQLSHALPVVEAIQTHVQHLPLMSGRGMPFVVMFHVAREAPFVAALMQSLRGRVFAQLPVLLFEEVAPQWVLRVQAL